MAEVVIKIKVPKISKGWFTKSIPNNPLGKSRKREETFELDSHGSTGQKSKPNILQCKGHKIEEIGDCLVTEAQANN